MVGKNYEHWKSKSGMEIVGNTQKRKKKIYKNFCLHSMTSEDYQLYVKTSDIIDTYKT